jgi:dethiobiotin synthetase
VYKPVATGCRQHDGLLLSDDAVTLWEAAGRPGSLDQVCPQRFAAPLAPHLAAAQQSAQVDRTLLRQGLDPWLDRSDVVIVEGVGGLMTPVNEEEYVADLAEEFGFPLIVVTRDALGAINQTLSALVVAATFGRGLDVAGVVLNQNTQQTDASVATNAAELTARSVPPLLGRVGWQATNIEPVVDWFGLARASASNR